jgi:hypothetical protein
MMQLVAVDLRATGSVHSRKLELGCENHRAPRPEGYLRMVFALLVLFFVPLFHADAEDAIAPLSQIDNADHGDTQVKWMLHDRPHLAEIVSPGNSIWNWLRDAFDYSDDGEKLYWDPSPSPATEIYGGQTSFLGSSKIIFVHLDDKEKEGSHAGEEKNAEELLETAVFELNNARHRKQIRAISLQVIDGKMSRDQYIQAMAGTEFESSQGVKNFQTTIWQPFCSRWNIKSEDWIWAPHQAATFDDWMKSFPPGSIYPYRVYGLEYDELVEKYREILRQKSQ